MKSTPAGGGQLTIDLSMPKWRKEAQCLDLDLNLFFEDYEDDEETAKFVDSVCGSCPVRKECLGNAIDTNASGVWSGMYLVLGSYSRSRNTHKTKTKMREEMNNLDEFRRLHTDT